MTIQNDPMTPTFLGQMALLLGESTALQAMNLQPLPSG
jgi:hypothetical protein